MKWPISFAAVLLLIPSQVQAGMPSVVLDDLVRMRLQSISFFALGFLLSACVVRWVWNSLRRDFPSLPQLGYLRACGVVGLWGLMFLLVLTMISGARELMTPGAWTKTGLTYRLADGDQALESVPSARAHADALLERRLAHIGRLRDALWAYAARHDGHFPYAQHADTIDADLWELPDATGLRYLYEAGLTWDDDAVLIYEPQAFGDERLVLFANGMIAKEWLGQEPAALPTASIGKGEPQ